MDDMKPDFSGDVRVFISRREILSCRDRPEIFISHKLYDRLVDVEKPIQHCDDFERNGMIFEGSVDESRWPLTATVLG